MLEINEDTTLEQLVSIFEENEIDLTQVPQQFIDQYGYSSLSNALMFKVPPIPKYDFGISTYIKNHTFKTLDSLILYVQSIDNDIDKLFAIFCYAAFNISYDTEAYFTDKRSSSTLEEVFETKKAVCQGYSVFFKEMSKKVNIDSNRITIKSYSNYAKGYSYNPLNPPKDPKSNHAAVFISIDNVPFICEPTWGSGHLTREGQFEFNFKPNMFLIPIYQTLNSHFPIGKSAKLLPFNFTYEDFLKSVITHSDKLIKTETIPFCIFDCETGFLEQTYSCLSPIENVHFNLFLRDGENFNKLSDDFCSFRIVQYSLKKHPDRCRFKTYITFPEIGFYKVEMFINYHCELTYYVNSLKSGTISLIDVYNGARDFIINEAAPTILNAVDETRQFVANDAVPTVYNIFNKAKLFVKNVAVPAISNGANVMKDFIMNDAVNVIKSDIIPDLIDSVKNIPNIRPNLKDITNGLIRVFTRY